MRGIFLFLVVVIAVNPAYALSIRNLSDRAHVVVAERGGARFELTLPPYATRHYTLGNIMLSLPGQRPIHADANDAYAIWPDGKLIIQRRNSIRGRSR